MARLWIALSILLASPLVSAQAEPDAVASYLCRQVRVRPQLDYEKNFSDEYRKQIPEAAMIEIFRDLAIDAGACVDARVTSGPPGSFLVIGETRAGNTVQFDVSLEANPPFRIQGLFVRDVYFPSIVIRDFQDLQRELKRLPGLATATIQAFGRPSASIGGEERQPIGSIFKLYVLGALERFIRSGLGRWTDSLAIRDAFKSLPSGVMHTWPAGKRTSLYEFARNMISISDNTATDHLIRLLGREKVEAELLPLGNSFVDANRPFLTTAEAFKIKWALKTEAQRKYLAMSMDERRNWLDQTLSRLSLSSVRYQPGPVLVREVEWFASTNDLCKAMFELDQRRSREVREILGVKVPLLTVGPGSHWRYAGFKGGSEPGVIAFSYLLESNRGNRGCVALAWHNPINLVRSYRMRDIVRKTLQLAERGI